MERKKVTKENSYFLKELETLPIDALKILQFEKTKETLKRAYYKSDFYRRRFDKASVKPEDFKTLEDIARFPFIDKQDLIKDQEENPPFGSRVCADPQKARRINFTDYFALVEVLDKDTDQPVAHGQWGEPVVTTFSREAMPLIRFRSNDRVRLLPPGLCGCGRTSRALWEVGTISRYDDMLKIKATNVWPQTVDEAVFSFDEIEEYNGNVFIDKNGQEVAKLKIEFKKVSLDESNKAVILRKLGDKIKTMTQVTMKLEEVPYGTLPRFEYKVRRWTDERIEGLKRVKYIEKK